MTEPSAAFSPPTTALIARYRAPLMSYFLRRLGNRSDAEDLTQEVFTRIVRQQDLDPLNIPDGLIFTIAANLLKDHHRRGNVRNVGTHVSLDADLGALNSEPGFVEILNPERALIAKERLALVLAALDDMPNLTRDIFLMYRLEGTKQREIAELFKISLSTVEKHLGRALKHLAENSRPS
jgi:RNA polymerase sigma factor (sigma-70 family)